MPDTYTRESVDSTWLVTHVETGRQVACATAAESELFLDLFGDDPTYFDAVLGEQFRSSELLEKLDRENTRAELDGVLAFDQGRIVITIDPDACSPYPPLSRDDVAWRAGARSARRSADPATDPYMPPVFGR